MRYGLITGVLAVALSLGACGVRGDLELPPARVDAAAPDGAAAEAERKPERAFILDPLL